MAERGRHARGRGARPAAGRTQGRRVEHLHPGSRRQPARIHHLLSGESRAASSEQRVVASHVTFDLDRFKRAQEGPGGFAAALAELEAGRKRSHWIWYVFPQLAGLGQSAMAVRYGLQGVAEARAYLVDPELRDRLLRVTNAVLAQLQHESAPALADVMGSEIDALKLVSSMTLFREVA